MSTLAHVKLVFQLAAGNRMTCGLDFESNNALTPANLDDMNNRAALEWTAGVTAQTLYAADIRLHSVEAFAYDIVANPSAPPPFKRGITIGPRVLAVNVAGSRAGASGPPNLTPVLSFRTLISSRRTRGRIYTPPVVSTNVNQFGLITAAMEGDLQTVWPNWITAIEQSATVPQTFTHSVVSLTGNLVTPVVVYEFKKRIDTQRRRLVRALDID